MQSRVWFEFQKVLGNDVIEISSEAMSAYGVVEKSDGKFGKFFKRLYFPYGPTLDSKNKNKILELIDEKARSIGVDYVRIEPISGATSKWLSEKGYKKMSKSFQPSNTSVIDLGSGWDKLLMEFRTSNRQGWRKAEAGALIFEKSQNIKDVDDFWKMLKDTESRTSTHMKSKDYFVTMVEFILKNRCGELIFAVHEGKRIASTIVFDDVEQRCRYYLYAASYPEARKLDAGASLVSFTIKDAIDSGLAYYDLFGVSPPDAPQDHRWYGFSKFKRSFAGNDVEFLGDWEKTVTYRHKVLNVLRKLR